MTNRLVSAILAAVLITERDDPTVDAIEDEIILIMVVLLGGMIAVTVRVKETLLPS